MNSVCRRCGKTIQWGVTSSGAKHPFDARPTQVLVQGPNGRAVTSGYVSHFATCRQTASGGQMTLPAGLREEESNG